jgi:hypothetical protein
MKTIYKICLINVALALFFAALFSATMRGNALNGFIPVLGLISVFGGAIDVIIGLILLAFKRRVWGQGYLLSAGILLLSGFVVCSFSGMM